MKKPRISLYTITLLFSLTDLVKAENETLTDRFLGSPVIVLFAVIIIAIIAAAYHRIRK